jgi:hypothetical protein
VHGTGVGRLHRVNGGANELLEDGTQLNLATKDDIGGVLDLGQVPLVGQALLLGNRTVKSHTSAWPRWAAGRCPIRPESGGIFKSFGGRKAQRS